MTIEALEHMKNYEVVFERFSRWLKDDGKAFIHIFVHKDKPYPFIAESDDDWMAQFSLLVDTCPRGICLINSIAI